VAIGEWNSTPQGKVRDTLEDEWRLAIVKADSGDHWISEMLVGDPELAAKWLKARLKQGSDFRYWRMKKAVMSAISVLDPDQKLEVMASAEPGIHGPVLELIAGDDLVTYEALLRNSDLRHLHLILLGKFDKSWPDKALLAQKWGRSPEEIIQASHGIWDDTEQSRKSLKALVDEGGPVASLAQVGLRHLAKTY